MLFLQDLITMFEHIGGAPNMTALAVMNSWAGTASVATMRRRTRRSSTMPNAKKMYEEALMVRLWLEFPHIMFRIL